MLYDAAIADRQAYDRISDHHVRKIRFVRQVEPAEGCLPYIVRRKVFENARSIELIRKRTGRGEAPKVQDVFDAEDRLVGRATTRRSSRIRCGPARAGW